MKISLKYFVTAMALQICIPTTAFAATTLEEITVTARKRSESLQEIPDSVTVFGASQIREARLESIKDFSALTPNLTVSSNFRSGLNFVTVRGLITPQVGEAPLAFVVDGVTVPSIEFINQGLHQIERIEILRGPQGALYGKNAIGGAVNIVTKQPSDELEGNLKASYGEGDDKRFSAAINGPLGDRVHFRLSGNFRDFGGLIDSSFLNEEVDFVNGEYGVQGLLKVDISEQTSFSLQGRYSDVEQGANYQAFITEAQLEDYSIEPNANTVGLDQSTLSSVTVKLDHQADFGDITLIAGYNDADVTFFSDADFTSLDATDENFFFPSLQNNPISEDALNIEARFSSPADDTFNWLVGVFYETRDRTVMFDTIFDLTPTERVTLGSIAGIDPSLVFIGERTVQDSDAFAFFGQANYDITDDLELTFAMRYDEEERDAFDERDQAASQASETFSEVQPKVSLAWQATDDALLSATYSKGFRSGGFNEFAPTVVRAYEEEVSDTIELGTKTSWLDGRLFLNAALFYIEQQDAQFTRFNPSTFTLENLNVDEVEIKGLEVEITAKPSENLDLALGFGIIDNEITENTGIDILNGLDLSSTVGNSMPYVSDFNINGSVTHSLPLSNGLEWKTRLSFNTLGPRSFDIINDATGESDSHTFINANIGLESENWSLSLYATNLTDEESPETVFFFNPLIRIRNQPRQIGIQADYSF